MKKGFLDKLIDRLDKMDPKSLQSQFLHLVQESGLLETIFQSIHEGVIVIDGGHRMKYANKAAEHLLGFAIDSALGKPIERYLRGIDWESILNIDDREWSNLISHDIEVAYPEHKFLNFYVVPLSAPKTSEDGAVLILRDVTHDRMLEANNVESERVNAVKLLAAGVAHEIGNPLNALNIHLQLLARELKKLREKVAEAAKKNRGEVGDEDVKGLDELLRVAREEVSRLDLILTQFLQAIRPAKPKLVLATVDGILKDALTLMKNEIGNRNIKIEVRASEPIPKIRIDRHQIKQAFFNVIKNAFQAMPDGGSLIISFGVSDQFVGISFRDTGKGIKQQDFGHIFDPYYTTRKDGSGLGLMILQRIVQDHGGRITVASKVGKGTEFTILLPLVERRMRLLTKGRERDTGSAKAG